jgi:hypothetical protein
VTRSPSVIGHIFPDDQRDYFTHWKLANRRRVFDRGFGIPWIIFILVISDRHPKPLLLKIAVEVALYCIRWQNKEFAPSEPLANRLGRSRRSIASHFDELRRQGICRMNPAVNQHQCTEIEVCDEFWPYTRANSSVESSESKQYLARIKAFLSKLAYVQSNFETADERTIANLLTLQVPLERIERAIALGCCRKYVSLLNGTHSGPIFRIGYFRKVIEEVRDPKFPSEYWSYVMPELQKLETKWLKKQEKTADAKLATGPKIKETG